MIPYISESQLSIEEFKTPFKNSLSPDNRWVRLAKIVNWDKFASAYISMMNTQMGRPGISPRIVLGALIIKYKEKLDDRRVISAIQENVYMQYFLGLEEFSIAPVFDPSLFVTIRKRVGKEAFDQLTTDLIKSISEKTDQKHHKQTKSKNGYNLNQIRATLKNTSESWVADIFFVMNLINYQKLCLGAYFLKAFSYYNSLFAKNQQRFHNKKAIFLYT